MEIYRGGCSCGAVHFELDDHPTWVLACHCGACKKWSGSDYAISVAIDADKVMSYTGETRTYSRTGDSGKDAHYQFCPNCGTTVRWTIDIAPLRSFFAGGAFDDIANLDLMAQMYADSSAPWVDLDCAITQPGPPDDPFRQAMIKEALSRR